MLALLRSFLALTPIALLTVLPAAANAQTTCPGPDPDTPVQCTTAPRAADPTVKVDDPGRFPASNNWPSFRFESLFTLPYPTGFTPKNGVWTNWNHTQNDATALSGGSNTNVNGYSAKTFHRLFDDHMSTFTPTQAILATMHQNKFSPGDALLTEGYVRCVLGITAPDDEGCETLSLHAFELPFEYQGSVVKVDANLVTVAPTAGGGSQGEGRWLVDLSQSLSGTIRSIVAGRGETPTRFQVDAHLPASTLSTPLRCGSFLPTPGHSYPVTVTCTPASMAKITPGSYLTVSDSDAIETVVVQSTTPTDFTATFAYPHKASAIATAGGLAGFCFSPDTDTATRAEFDTLETDLHSYYPIIRSTATSIDVWYQLPANGYVAYQGAAQPARHPKFHAAPCARVTRVRKGLQLSDELQLEPSAFHPAPGDAVIEPHYYLGQTWQGFRRTRQYLQGPNQLTANQGTREEICCRMGTSHATAGGNLQTVHIVKNLTPPQEYLAAGGALDRGTYLLLHQGITQGSMEDAYSSSGFAYFHEQDGENPEADNGGGLWRINCYFAPANTCLHRRPIALFANNAGPTNPFLLLDPAAATLVLGHDDKDALAISVTDGAFSELRAGGPSLAKDGVVRTLSASANKSVATASPTTGPNRTVATGADYIIQTDAPTHALELNPAGNPVTVNGKLLCLSDGTNCAAAGPPLPWTSGPTPPTGPCRTGSLYSNTTGGRGSTLFACEGGEWVAK